MIVTGTQIVRVLHNETNVWIAKTILWENNVNSASKFPLKVVICILGGMREGSGGYIPSPQSLEEMLVAQKYKM